jgi:hypothetical protein
METNQSVLANLIRQSQNDFDENSSKKQNSFDDLTKLNQKLNHLNQQVRFSFYLLFCKNVKYLVFINTIIFITIN